MASNLLIIGAGGHAREVLWLASRCLPETQIQVAVEAGWEEPAALHGIRVVTLDSLTDRLSDLDCIIAIGDCAARKRIAGKLDAAGATSISLIDPSVLKSSSVLVGAGTIVCGGAVLTCDVEVGRHVIVNTGCLVHHNVIIGDYSTLAPGVRIAGHVELGSEVYVGIGATIINGTGRRPLRIGDCAVVAAGACVTKDVPDGAMVAGVPAVRKR